MMVRMAVVRGLGFALIGMAAFGGFGACGGSTDAAPMCSRGDTRECLGEGRCEGAQTCLEDRSGYDRCVCKAGGTGGSAGTSGVGRAGSGPGGDGGTSGTSADASAGAAGVFGSAGVAGAISFDGAPSTDANVVDACAFVRDEATPRPLDMFILLDQSSSMVTANRWQSVTDALRAFVQSPQAAGVGVGIGYFGLHPAGPAPDPSAPGSCNANDYARPDVPIDVLPNVRQAMIDSLSRHAPGGGSPTHPALQGAMQYLTTRAVAHPDHKAIVVLLTDGEPQGCTGNDVNTVSQLAAAGNAANPQINTYVVALGNVQGLNPIAQAGGTQQVFAVPDVNANAALLDAMKQISGLALGCEFEIPRLGGRPLDFTKVNVLHTPSGGGESIIYHVNSLADCRADIGGWYYERDAQGNPTGIRLCPVSCSNVVAGSGRLAIAIGCSSIPPPPPS